MSAAVAAAVLYGAPPLAGLALARIVPRRPFPRPRLVDALVPVGLAAQLASAAHPAAVRTGYVLLGIWVAVRIAGALGPVERLAFALLGLGGGLNAVAIFLNGAMPYAGHQTADGLKGTPITPDTHAAWLGDVIPFAGKLVSVGDLVLAAGTACLVAAVAGATAFVRLRRWARRSAEAPSEA